MQKIKKITIPLLVVIVSVLVLITGILAVKYIQIKSNSQKTPVEVDSWSIYKIEPENNLFNLTLKSSSGIIRYYKQLASFGLSANGQYLAFYKEKQLNFNKLDSDTTTKVTIPLENIRVSPAESINWDYSNQYFGFGLVDINTNKTYVALNNINQPESKLITANITFNDSTIEPVIFSPLENKFIVRTYNLEDSEYPKEDGTMPSLFELPIILRVFNFEGTEINSLQVSDYSTSQYIKYGFDSKGRAEYFINEKPIETFINQDLFTKIAL